MEGAALIPTTIMLHKAMDEISSSFDKAVDDNPNQLNSHYVVDTLDWAATSNLNNEKQIFANYFTFTALKNDGSAVTWKHNLGSHIVDQIGRAHV